MTRRNVSWLVGGLVALCLAFAAAPKPAEAGGLRARVYLSQRKIPKKLGMRGLLGFVRKNGTKRLRETNEPKLNDRKFKAEMVTAFNRPPGDLEFHVLFYDVHDGPRRFVSDMSTFIDDRKEKVFVQRVKLPRPEFKPNRRMELIVTVRRQEVGKLKFITDGEEIRRSGTVDFGDDEA